MAPQNHGRHKKNGASENAEYLQNTTIKISTAKRDSNKYLGELKDSRSSLTCSYGAP